MTDVTIRAATVDDLDDLIDLRRTIAGEGVWIGAQLPLDEPRDRRSALDTITRDDATFLVAELDGELVGALAMWDHVGIADLTMMVAAGHRGRGIGRSLLTESIEWARSIGCHKVSLDRWPWNEPAGRLYESFGFEVEGYRRRHWRRKDGSLWDAVVMGLVLDDTSPGHDMWATEPPGERPSSTS